MIQPDTGHLQQLEQAALAVNERLQLAGSSVVLAESCTGGLIASTLARIPGVSACLAGSFVVYQIASKTAWIGVQTETIRTWGVVSESVAREMAAGALLHTPHAAVSLAITGDLGPNASAETDGTAWLAVASRQTGSATKRITLAPASVADFPSLRWMRQQQAATLALEFLLEWLH
ncbi:MAG: CinA family protein [Planctomycetota bacterium]